MGEQWPESLWRKAGSLPKTSPVQIRGEKLIEENIKRRVRNPPNG
jgi:hypothetical protein